MKSALTIDCKLKETKTAPALKGAIVFREPTMTVRTILDTKGHQIESIGPDAKLAAAIKILSERKIGAVLVMSSAVMTPKVVSCRQADTVAAIMEIMTLGKFRHLPVVAEGKVVGLISIGDIVKWRVMEFEAEQEALRDYIKTA